MSDASMDAVRYYSAAASRFHASYAADANRQERLAVWARFIDRFSVGAAFAYDLGCGSGILACSLARRGIETVGLDGAAGMLAIARRNAADQRLGRVSFVEQHLPVAHADQWRPADLVISSSALEYLPSLPDALRSVHGMMRRGGVLVFSVSNRESLSRAAVRLVHRLTGRPAYFGLLKQFRTPSQLYAELEAAGFTPLDCKYFARADRVNRLLARFVPVHRASNMIIVAARRQQVGRLRVLLVGPMPPTKGGVTTFMLNLMASPLAAEVTFLPFTTSRPPKRNVTENWGYRAMLRGGVGRIAVGGLVTAWHLASFPFAVLRHRANLVQIQASDYQVFWEAGLYALMARLIRRPVLLRIGGAFDIFWGDASRLERRLIAAVLRLPAVVIAQSAFAREVIRCAGREGEIVLLPNWAHALPPARPPGTGVPACLFIAGLEAKRKGVEEVLAAAVLLQAQGVAVRFHIVAATPALAARVAALGLPGITTEGPAAHAGVLALMRRCAVFLLPSHGEGFPNSLVEAMAAGMACIATPVGAVPEMAEGGGVLSIPVGDAVALAAAIRRLAGSAELRAALGERARATVGARYTAAAALPGLVGAYRRCSPGRAGSAAEGLACPQTGETA